MTDPQHHFGSIDPEDRPVPLVPDPADDVLGIAERLVREAQQEIGREDTEPSVAVIPPLTTAEPHAAGPAPWRPASPRLKVAVLVVTTVAAFLHGWHQGASTGATTAVANESGPQQVSVNQQ